MRYPADMSDVRHLTIRTFPAGDPRGYFLVRTEEMVRMGEPLSCFRTRVGRRRVRNLAVQELLTYPEVHERVFLCSVCDTIIPLEEPLAPRIREMAIELGNPEARMQLVITHPTDLPETKRGDVTYPFVVNRYERYFPVEPRVPQ